MELILRGTLQKESHARPGARGRTQGGRAVHWRGGNALGIVHRDLEPSNLFLTSTAIGSALVKFIDFGFAEQSADVKGDIAALAQIAIEDTSYPRYDGARTTGSPKFCPPPSASQAPPALKAQMS